MYRSLPVLPFSNPYLYLSPLFLKSLVNMELNCSMCVYTKLIGTLNHNKSLTSRENHYSIVPISNFFFFFSNSILSLGISSLMAELENPLLNEFCAADTGVAAVQSSQGSAPNADQCLKQSLNGCKRFNRNRIADNGK